MKMPVNYVVEMYIDRVAASKNYQKDKYREDSALRYYLNGKELHILHEDTRELLELLLYMLAARGEKETNTFIRDQILSHRLPYEKAALKEWTDRFREEVHPETGQACPAGEAR